MAEMLKRQFDLLALKIAMDLSGDSPRVGIELQARSEGELGTLAEWSIDVAEIGLPARLTRSETLYQGYTFNFPDTVLAALNEVLADGDYQDRPLWLHLARPLGYLNLVPWEQLLQPALMRPVLRLPDFLANPPRESLQSLEVALCGSMPAAKAAFSAVDYLTGMARLLLETVPRRTMVHIFCDAELFPEVAGRVDHMQLDGVQVHDPAEAESFAPAERQYVLTGDTGRVQNPWLKWMRAALSGRGIDLVHFLTHGYLSRDSGALAFAESPLENLDRRIARFVGAAELLAFLNQVGAWCVAFSSPEHNFSEMGLRLLADTIAQQRPGPVLHHEMRLDTEGADLSSAYRFLFGRGSVPPPASPALFTYCHPSLLESAEPAPPRRRRKTRGRARGERPAPQADELLSEVYQQAEAVPSWVSSSQRYLEQRRRDLQRMQRHDESASASTRRHRIDDAKVIQETLEQIEATLGDVLASKGYGSD